MAQMPPTLATWANRATGKFMQYWEAGVWTQTDQLSSTAYDFKTMNLTLCNKLHINHNIG